MLAAHISEIAEYLQSAGAVFEINLVHSASILLHRALHTDETAESITLRSLKRYPYHCFGRGIVFGTGLVMTSTFLMFAELI